MALHVRLLHPEATLPTRGSPLSAGLDIYALEGGIVPAGKTVRIPTGIAIDLTPKLPEAVSSVFGKLETRSSMAALGVIVVGGIIDSDYRGEISVCLCNTSEVDYEYTINAETGDKPRIAQLIVQPFLARTPVIVESLDETERGEGGFGSTGA